MSPELIGLIAGLVAGVIAYVAIAAAAKQIEGDQRDPAKVKNANLLRTVAKLDILIFAALGYFIGPMVLQ